MRNIFHYTIFQKILQFLLWVVLFIPSSVLAEDIVRPDPEIATDYQEVKLSSSQNFMVVTANPHATKAAYDVLHAGGSAADAGIAAQLVLGLTEPQSSGLGGGAFALYYDAKTGKIHSFDAREKAPALAKPEMFLDKEGKPIDFKTAVLSEHAIGVPGVPQLLEGLYLKFGKSDWFSLFYHPLKLAQEGFEISPRLAAMIKKNANALLQDPEAASYFLETDGSPKKEGMRLHNPDYAFTIMTLRDFGASSFYEGEMASKIAAKIGPLSLQDMQSYKVIGRKPVCGPYRKYKICSMGEPSSGGLTLLMILGMLQNYDVANLGPRDPLSWHYITEASRLAFADRNKYMADSDFVKTPGESLLDPLYLTERSSLIIDDIALESMEAGDPPWNPLQLAPQKGISRPGTSHISIIDAEGNILSMTTTIEGAFGSHKMVGGFLLNNQLTDFSFLSKNESGRPIANRVEPNKRPRSSMAPTIIFDSDGKAFLIIGSAGGSNIIGYVLQRIIAVIDWDIPIDQALAMPNILAKGNTIDAEKMVEGLGHRKAKIRVKDMNSGLTAIHIQDGILYGAADPRREGLALGD